MPSQRPPQPTPSKSSAPGASPKPQVTAVTRVTAQVGRSVELPGSSLTRGQIETKAAHLTRRSLAYSTTHWLRSRQCSARVGKLVVGVPGRFLRLCSVQVAPARPRLPILWTLRTAESRAIEACRRFGVRRHHCCPGSGDDGVRQP